MNEDILVEAIEAVVQKQQLNDDVFVVPVVFGLQRRRWLSPKGAL